MRGLWLVAAVSVALAPAELPVAQATIDDIAINGTLRAVSDGQWAKTNEIFHDESTVSSLWTVTSACTGVFDCTGTVHSDQGWTAPIRYQSLMWYVSRTLPDWEHCADGTSVPGKQIVKFYRDPNDPTIFKGWDTVVGPSGACGINTPLVVEMPFKLTPP